MMDFIAKPFGIIMQYIYNFSGSYGLAIIVFTIFVRILLFPLNLKQQKSTLRTQELQPEIDELKRRYGDDKNKFNEEQMKLYQKYNINPMGGCLPMLIQLPLILAIFRIVSNPLTHISNLSTDIITKLREVVGASLNITKLTGISEITINNHFMNTAEDFSKVADIVKKTDFINMKFLKIFDLGLNPTIGKGLFGDPLVYLPLLLIPILSLVTTYFLQKMTTNPTKKDKGKENKEKAPPNPLESMTKIMPFMTLFFTFMVPAGVGLYWIIGNILGIGQNYVTKLILEKEKEGKTNV